MAVPLTSLELFFGLRKYKIGSSKVGFIKFDLILSEGHNLSNEVTEHPVEDGSVISDHIRNNLENGTLTVIVTNFSLKTIGLFTNRAQDAYNEMVRIWKSRELVTIISILQVYNNIAIRDVSTERTADTGSAIIFDISFQKIKKIKLRTVETDVGVNIDGTDTDIKKQSKSLSDQGRTTGITP